MLLHDHSQIQEYKVKKCKFPKKIRLFWTVCMTLMKLEKEVRKIEKLETNKQGLQVSS